MKKVSKNNPKSVFKRILAVLVLLTVVAAFTVIGTNFYIKKSTTSKIFSLESFEFQDKVDCIIVLGAGVRGETPSPILEDRLDTAIQLYESGVSDKLLMTGDHHRKGYNEVQVMKDYAISKGVPSEDIFMDHAGLSTYESMKRANKIFLVEKAVVVTQKYHLYRSLYLSNSTGIESVGVLADIRRFNGELYRESREILARTKDFFVGIVQPKTYIGGEEIPISGDGNITND